MTTCFSFIEQAKELDKQGHTDEAIDLIYDKIDEMLLAGYFHDVDLLLSTLSVSDLSMDLLLSILMATLPAKKRLVERDRFFKNVEQILRQRHELRDGLLIGLN